MIVVVEAASLFLLSTLFSFSFSVIWMDIYRDNINGRRISCFACQNGFLKVVVVNENGTNHDSRPSAYMCMLGACSVCPKCYMSQL